MFANVVCDASGKWKGLLYLNLNLLRTLSSSAETTRQEIVKCCRILRVAEDSTLDDIRAAFITLAKKYHPDSDSPEANAEKFQEVESAYRILQAKYLADQRHEMASNSNTKSFDAVQEYDIQTHTAPQHRQYLSFDGYGSGTPSQRQKQYQKQRAVTAVDNVMSHRIRNLNLNCSHNREEALAVKDKTEAKKIKSRYGMERLVEDLIQESIAKGDFDNLSGKGKPLKQGVANPYVDFTTHKLNEVLIDNGFTPEWILLQKEIREERDHVRQCLIAKRKTLGLLPLSGQDEHIWKVAVKNCEPLVQQINKKINKYNLVVPILQKQMLQVQLDKEADKILQEIKGESLDTPDLKNNFEKSAGNSLFNLFHEIFGK